ncbi:MAG: peptidylprolyl isomerase [Bdellovibrionales bacterium]|nr:peptidylprolyl isomerase [Bdellovibrionales bacterium]
MNKWLVIFILFFTLSSSAKVVEGIVAIVNSEFITKSDVEDYKNKLKNGGLIDEAFLSIVDTKELLKNEKKLIDFLIDQKLLDSEVKAQNLSVPFERVEKEIRTISRANNVSRSQLKAALKEKGILFSDYQDFIKTSLERKSLIEKVITSKIKISDEDITSYYISHKGAQESVAFEYKIAHILTLIKNDPNRAKQKIQQALDELNKNIGFEDVVEKYSEDPNFADGGLLGTYKSGEMLSEIETTVKNLKVGSYSGIIKTKAGFHIVRLLKKTIVESPTLSKEKERIRIELTKMEFQKRFKTWLTDKRTSAFVRIN